MYLGRRGRLSFRFMRKRNRLLFELGIGIILIIVFFGMLNALTTTHQTALLTTEQLADTYKTIVVSYKNSTTGTYKTIAYNLSDIATLYNNYLYISIPAIDGYDLLDSLSFTVNNDSEAVNFNDLIDNGLSKVEFYVESIDTEVYNGTNVRIELWSYSGGYYFEDVTFNGSKVDANISIDFGSLILKLTNRGLIGKPIKEIKIQLADKPLSQINGFKVKLEFLAISKKRVLKALTEPVAGVFSSMYAAVLAAFRRVKNYAVTLFGGWLSGFTFTGLIGDPVTALVVSVAVITIVYYMHVKR